MTEAFLIESHCSQSAAAAAAEAHPGDHCCQTCSPERRFSLSFPTESPPCAGARSISPHRRTRECLAGAVVSPLTDTRGLPGTPFSRIVEHDPVKSARRFCGERRSRGRRRRTQRRSGSFLTESVYECRWSTWLVEEKRR